MPTFVKSDDFELDWPDEIPRVTVECAGPGFGKYHEWLKADQEQLWQDWLAEDRAEGNGDEDEDGEDEEDDGGSGGGGGTDDESSLPVIDLFSLSELELQEVDYYQVLHLPYQPTLTPDDVKKAYRKACLKYHPDKSGRGEEDAVFLKVKAAFETLSTQKTAYDSTEMPFDDELPPESPVVDFFAAYGPVFQRNLHFDARLLASNSNNNNNQSNGNKKRNKKSSRFHKKKPPSLGDADTSIDKVHEFYDYWTHFESWRDFTLLAARELETEDHLENAESRYEKRWYQKEIDRHAKKLKQQEVARITTLVERAMAVDPRLIQERKRMIEEKERRQREREQEVLDKKKAAEEAKREEERKEEEEKKRKADEKLQREKEKKQFRKVKQIFRRQASDALEQLVEKEHALEDEVDLICNELDRLQLSQFNDRLESLSAQETVSTIKNRAAKLKDGAADENGVIGGSKAENDETDTKSNVTDPAPSSSTATAASSSAKAKLPFTKEELSALAKGVKKFPPGGANRWDQIANYLNNLCRPEDPRSKEECIETFNQINKSAMSQRNGGSTSNTPATNITVDSPTPSTETSTQAEASDGSVWTPAQDQQLQTGLSAYPATMDKNERWTKIAQGVAGKSKKDCVQRFKEIRTAIKAKK